MNAQATRRGLPAIALWGGLGAIAWAAITVLTGGSSAHADEKSDAPLLDGVTSLVSQTVSSVGDTVTAVTSPVVAQVVKPVVTEVVAPVVTQVVAPVQQSAPPVVEHVSEAVVHVPVVGPATAPVVEAVTDTAEAVVAPVTDLLTDAPASQIVTPVQDALAALPGVGHLLDELGVNTILDDVVDVVDTTTEIVGDVVENTVPPVLGSLDPTGPDSSPSIPGAALSGTVDTAIAVSTLPATLAAAGAQTAGGSSASTPRPVAPPAAPATSAPEPEGGTPVAPPVGGPLAPSSSAGSGGASSLSHARLSDVGVPAFRAVERTPGAPDDVLPTSLVADTVVSPD